MQEKERVLIIDDEPIARTTFEAFLHNDGYEIQFAVNGLEGLKKLVSFSPDVILLDVMMPGMDGFEVCQWIKSKPEYRNIPIIIVTALYSNEDLAKALDVGADEFISKPVSSLELCARVRSMLRIRKQYLELEASIQLREDLANMVVHDIRSPLTIILGQSQSLIDDERLSHDLHRRADSILSQAKRLNTFINDMLLMAKMEHGQLIPERVEVDISQLLEDTQRNFASMAENRHITLEIDLPDGSAHAMLDIHLFPRVMDNLLSNALKFSPIGGKVILRAFTNINKEQANLSLQVIDEGPGIPQRFKEQVFDKFRIVELKQSGVAQIGLGLAFCKMVVEAHGGSIAVEDNSPVGSIFDVVIPE